ncbi:uncharacterized protein JCM6883_006892 [Sporobolomyces salmoneus]|uniref:uncharacterized protein n=1 Tax=Sporobolomyces salmoneus TaxID=183962 RepID=UPI00317C432E
MTDSSTKSSSPSLLSAISASAETPPRSPDTVRSNNSKSPHSTSPLPPLPPEVFLSILRFLPHRDQLRACLVSQSWRNFILSEPEFWSSISVSLNGSDFATFQDLLFRSVGNGNKKREGPKTLRISHDLLVNRRSNKLEHLVPLEVAKNHLDQVLDCVEQAAMRLGPGPDSRYLQDPVTGRYSTLRHLYFDLRVHHVDTLVLMDKFAKRNRAVLFNLETLSVRANVPDELLTGEILFLAPNVRSLSLLFAASQAYQRPLAANWHWHLPDNSLPRPLLNNLEELEIQGAIIDGILLPESLPRLRKMWFRGVIWRGKGIFRLLRLARRTLQNLRLDDLRLDAFPGDEYEDWCENVDIRDQALTDGHHFAQDRDVDEALPPCPILLPKLRNLQLTGRTPALFADLLYTVVEHDMVELPTPMLVMPNLVNAHFEEIDVDPEVLGYHDLPPLLHFGRHAPKVVSLTISSCQVEDDSILAGLRSMEGRITTLDFYDSTISDHLLSRLPEVVPLLRSLDVRSCVDTTCQGVARLVEVIRSLDDEGRCGVEKVWVDKPPEYGAIQDSKAYHWLDFIGVLMRGDDDFEGSGPSSPRERRTWIREGKKDVMADFKEQWRQKELALAQAKEYAQKMELYKSQAAGVNPSSSSSGGGGGGGSSSQQFSIGSHSVGPAFAPPPLHQNHQRTHSAPHQPQQHTFVLPKPPPPHPSVQNGQHPTFKYHVPETLAPAPFGPQSFPAYANSNAPTQVPNGQAPVQSQESKLDLTSLDSIHDLSELDPALLREQQLALEQIEKSRQHQQMARSGSSGGGGGAIVSQDEAYAAAQRESQRQMQQASEEQQRRQQQAHQNAIYSIAGLPTTVPSTADPRMAGLEHLRTRGGGFITPADDEIDELEPLDEDGGGTEVEDDDDILPYEDAVGDTISIHPNTLR